MSLTPRRIELLKAIIEEYVRTAEPVGSKNLVKRYKLRISPATVRNEMAILLDDGYLNQPHTSAGRVPAPLGLRYYIHTLLDEDDVGNLVERDIKRRIEEEKDYIPALLTRAATELSNITDLLAFALHSDGIIYSFGFETLLTQAEFYDIDVTRDSLHLMDHPALLKEVVSSAVDSADVSILIGDELGIRSLSSLAMVFMRYNLGSSKGYLGILGPTRLDYSTVIPSVRLVTKILTEVTK